MIFSLNSAIHIGHDHIFERKNLQDFCKIATVNNTTYGIICDGCSEGTNSEIGANLLGTFILKKLQQLNAQQQIKSDLATILTHSVYTYIDEFLRNLMIFDISEQVDFIKNNLLATFIFFIIDDINTLIGRCGDGVIVINNDVIKFDQDNSPHYLAYGNIPDKYLTQSRTKLSGIEIRNYLTVNVKRLIIGSDGLTPLINHDKYHISDLYGTKGRQLQRRINVWQNEKLFNDDVCCAVFETLCATCNSPLTNDAKEICNVCASCAEKLTNIEVN